MGASQSCPPGFEEGLFFSCRATCPPEFKYVQEGGGTQGPPIQKCIHIRRNNKSFVLNSLPKVDQTPVPPLRTIEQAEEDRKTRRQIQAVIPPVPDAFKEELDRVASERQRVLKDIEEEDTSVRLMNESRDQLTDNVRSFSKIETDYAVFNENKKLVEEIRKTNQSLKPLRPPTAPSSDLEKERREITNLATRNLYFIQIALFLVVLSMLSYFVFSLDTANLIAFGLLCVGIALGFFLRR